MVQWSLSLHANKGRELNGFYTSVSPINICVRKALVQFLREVSSLTFYFFCGWSVSSLTSFAIFVSAAAYSLTASYTLTMSSFCIHVFPQVLPCSLTLEGLLGVPLAGGNGPRCVLLKGTINPWAYSIILEQFYCTTAFIFRKMCTKSISQPEEAPHALFSYCFPLM